MTRKILALLLSCLLITSSAIAGPGGPIGGSSGGSNSGGSPGGSNLQVQYRINSTTFGGISGATTDGTTLTLIAPVLGVASGTSLALTGTGGAGFQGYVAQSSTPSAPASGFSEFADSSGRKSWIRASDGFVRTWDATLTGNRVYTLPDATGTIPLLSFSQTWSGTQTFGSGVLVATSPSFTTPVLGTPSSGTLTNATGLPPAGVVGTAAIIGANTFTGQQIVSLNGALSAPPVSVTGTWLITGGTATTTKPQVLIEPTGATSTAWVTTGTGLGINAASGFAGNIFDFQIDGVQKISYTSAGFMDLRHAANAGPRIRMVGTAGANFVIGVGTGIHANFATSDVGIALANASKPFYFVDGGNIIGVGVDPTNQRIGFSTSTSSTTMDTFIGRDAAATLKLGINAASAIAQTLKAHDGSGTDKAGANLTIAGGNGTGTGAGGVLNFNTTAVAGGSASTQNTSTTRFQITAPGNLITGLDNAYDIGASGATRPKNYYGAGFVDGVGGFKVNGTAGISVTCTILPTQMVITGGLITSVTGGTCS